MREIIDNIKKVLHITNGNVYIVGGYIRDKLLNMEVISEDLDIIYEGDIKDFIDNLEMIGYSIFPIKESIGIYRSVIKGKIIDIAKLKGRNIEEDLRSRDFTINAIALKLIENKIIDPFKGREHLKAKLIHEVTDNSIKDDKVRILRAYRLSLKLGMHFSKSCEEHIIEESRYIKQYPKERIYTELIKLIEEDKEAIAFEALERCGVLQNLIPYIDELKVIGKCRYHIEDAFTHMNLVYKNFKALLKGNLTIKGLDLELLNNKLGGTYIKSYIAFAAFSHDIGKAKCYKKIEDKVSFIGHDKVGAEIISEVCEELGFPKEGKKLIEILVEAHMYPLGLCKNRVKNNKKSFYKLFSRYDKFIPFILTLSYCDMYATKMLYDPDNEEELFKKYIEQLFEEYKLFRKARDNRFINGKQVMEITKREGKEIKLVLEDLEKKTYFGLINNAEEAINYLKGIKNI
ncbi:multifunctional CCA protein [Clostridium homopropionicum DSM 5847]|uniref:Multifunctional CCA protein n=1 Tax=Clostridium homopropionicum DSM 5847 TaxID=1121318 RepID=A0A0L6Z807_9CLOT|nr:HD domain-containing protein [Clostridium homopropionicum]KOA19106.1 multifunctional CCA protein [Clostridium homopropionicum DSM 5847]SFG83799.1 poly(A) polymerase [Clostridium homopropionicum]